MTHPGGRPTKYTTQMPAKILEAMGKKGFSKVRFASSIGVHIDTLHEWCKVHPEFSEAFKIASQDCEAYWENWLVDNFVTDKDKKVNSNLVKLFFANRFGWSDKQDTSHSGEVGFRDNTSKAKETLDE